MKHKKLVIFLAVIIALIAAYWISSLVLTSKMSAKMDDSFASAEKQVFSLDPEKITSIAVQNGSNGEVYEFKDAEFTWALEKLNGFRAKRIVGLLPIETSGWSYRIIVEDDDGNFGSYYIEDNLLRCDFVAFYGADGEFSEFVAYVSLP